MQFEGLGLPELITLVAAIIVYFMPWYIAVLRDHRRRFMIGLLNLLLGWTLIGWLAAFFWAASKARADDEPEKAEQAHVTDERVPVDSAAAQRYSRAPSS